MSYRFVDDNLSLFSGISAEQFDKEFGDISGQIELNFNENTIGFFHKDVPFGNEILLHWFNRLNEVVCSLQDSKYVAMNQVENNNWVEFVREESRLKINLIVNPSISEIHGFITKIPFPNYEAREWSNIIISYDAFKNEIRRNTEQLMIQLKELNINLLDTIKVIQIKNLLEKCYD